jgi:glucose-1-phosphate thymidylyltransferase
MSMAVKGLILANAPEPTGSGAPDRLGFHHLLPVANAPILLHALDALRRSGIRDVAIVVAPHTHDATVDALNSGAAWGLQVTPIAAPRAGGAADALLAAEDFLDGAGCLLQPGDALLKADLAGLAHEVEFDDSDALELVHVGARRARALPAHEAVAAGAGGSQLDEIGERRPELRAVARGADGIAGDGSLPPGLVATGACLLGAGMLARARDCLEDARGEPGLGSVFEALRRDGARVHTRLVLSWRRYGGDVDELLQMNRAVLDELEEISEAAGRPRFAGSQVEGRVVIHPTAHVDASVIRGPAIIGAGASVVDAYIGPYTSIGDSARIEGAEVEHSIVLPGASVLHIGGRLETSVIGRGAKVFRDFSIPRSLRLQVGDGAQVSLR